MVESNQAKLAQVEERIHRLGLDDEDLRNLGSSGHDSHRTASHSTLRAPFAGVITMQDVFVLADTSVVWVLAGIYEKDLGQVEVGWPCRVKVPAYPEEVFTGKIAYLSDVLDPTSRTGKMRCVLTNPDGRLKLEMFATVEIPLPLKHPAVLLPEAAVQRVDQQTLVFVAQDDSHFEAREVELGERFGDSFEVRRGLRAGEKVVTQGAFYVKSELLRDQLGGEE